MWEEMRKYRPDPYFNIQITTHNTKCHKMIKLSYIMHYDSTNVIIIIHLATLRPYTVTMKMDEE